MAAASELVFIPRVGFRQARALGTRANLVVERDGKMLAVAIAPDRDGFRLEFTVSGIAIDPGPDGVAFEDPIRVHDDHGRVVARRPRWFMGGRLRRAADGTATLRASFVLEPLAPDVRSVTLAFTGPAGDWDVELPVEPITPDGLRGRPIDVRDATRGAIVSATAVARSAELTAIELEARLDESPSDEALRRRSIRGIGCGFAGRLCGDQLVLRDDIGVEHIERGHPCLDPDAGRHREVVQFSALAPEVVSGVIEVQYLWVQEAGDEVVTVPLPGEADISLAGCSAHVIATRVSGVYTAGSVHVEVAGPIDPDADRQLVYVHGVNVADGSRLGMRISHAVGQRPIVEVPEPTGTAREVTLQFPVVQVRGPWRLEVPLDAS